MAVLAQNTIIQNPIQNPITEKLANFISQNKIPHILFHGPSGSGKRSLVYKFVEEIYNNDKQLIKNYTMFADCAHGKGIKFIREDLKFFAKTNINIQGVGHFKTIVLTNADKLTTDAQSALRRCIELFSHNTRFFIIVENKYNLLKPIISRLCDIFIGGGVTPPRTPLGISLEKSGISLEKSGENAGENAGENSEENGVGNAGGISLENAGISLENAGISWGKLATIPSSGSPPTTSHKHLTSPGGGSGGATPNYYKLNIAKFLDTSEHDKLRSKYLENDFNKLQENTTIDTIVKVVNKLYQKGYSGLDLMNYIEGMETITSTITSTDTSETIIETETAFLLRKYELLIHFHKVKAEFRNEKIFMTFILTFFFIRSKTDLENISFM